MLEFIGAKVPKKLMIMVYLCHCKQGERRLARKPVHLNFNYWKRTEKAGSDTGFFYSNNIESGENDYICINHSLT